jgi:DnaJ family protein A protein 2
VKLEDIYIGKLHKISHERKRICEKCEGKGGSKVNVCTPCKGKGMVEKMI